MADDNDKDCPIQKALKAFKKGTTLLQRICNPARTPDIAYTEDSLKAAQSLESSLLQNETKIRDSYTQNLTEFGQLFIIALAADRKLYIHFICLQQL